MARKAHVAQYQRMLFDLENDIAGREGNLRGIPMWSKSRKSLLNRVIAMAATAANSPPAGVKPKAAF